MTDYRLILKEELRINGLNERPSLKQKPMECLYRVVNLILDETDPMFMRDIGSLLYPVMFSTPSLFELSFYFSKAAIDKYGVKYGIKGLSLEDAIRKIYDEHGIIRMLFKGARRDNKMIYRDYNKLESYIRRHSSFEENVIIFKKEKSIKES